MARLLRLWNFFSGSGTSIEKPRKKPPQVRQVRLELEALEDRCLLAVVWGGGVDREWNDPNNWQQNRVPTANDDVIIARGSAIQRNAGFADSVTVQANGALKVFGSLIVNGTLTNRGDVEIQGSGTITARHVENRHILDIFAGRVEAPTVTNDGLLGTGLSGFIKGNVTNNRVISVGPVFANAASFLSVDGDFTQTQKATLQVHYGRPFSDRLAVTGKATLAGSLAPISLGPGRDSNHVVVAYGSNAGTFGENSWQIAKTKSPKTARNPSSIRARTWPTCSKVSTIWL